MPKRFRDLVISSAGATAMTYAITLPVVLGVVGLAVDLGKHYAVRSMLQQTVDVALLGAMKSIREIPDVDSEFRSLFFANYPRVGGGGDSWYMGTTVLDMSVTHTPFGTSGDSGNDQVRIAPVEDEISRLSGEYTAVVRVNSPNYFMRIFGHNNSIISASASAINNTEETQKKAFVTFVLDTTGSMCIPNCVALEGLKAASSLAIEILSNAQPTLENIWLSIIPYSTAVAFSPDETPAAANWARSPWDARAAWQQSLVNKVYLANRNPDKPADPAYDDLSLALPTTDVTKFRTPQMEVAGNPSVPFVPGIGTGAYWGWDLESGSQQTAKFLEQDKASLLALVNGLSAEGYTRINVGLGWGARAMEDSWEDLLNPNGGTNVLPSTYNTVNLGYMVLMTDGENTVYLQQELTTSHDNTALLDMCTAVKTRGIRLFVIGLGASVNTALLTQCASANSYYPAPTPAQLRPIFENLAVLIIQELGLRLTR